MFHAGAFLSERTMAKWIFIRTKVLEMKIRLYYQLGDGH